MLEPSLGYVALSRCKLLKLQHPVHVQRLLQAAVVYVLRSPWVSLSEKSKAASRVEQAVNLLQSAGLSNGLTAMMYANRIDAGEFEIFKTPAHQRCTSAGLSVGNATPQFPGALPGVVVLSLGTAPPG